jgi:hypothetical protein
VWMRCTCVHHRVSVLLCVCGKWLAVERRAVRNSPLSASFGGGTHSKTRRMKRAYVSLSGEHVLPRALCAHGTVNRGPL